MSFFAFVFALLKAIPVVDVWFQSFMVFYTQRRIASMKRENVEAIRKAFETQDQRPIERTIGNPRAGELSGVEGTEIRDTLPGVKP